MAFGFKSVGHFFASVGKDLVNVAKTVGPVLVKVDATVEANKPLIETVSALINPAAPAIEDAAFSVLGTVAQAIQAADAATAANGLNVQLDAQTVTDIKALLTEIENYAKGKGLAKPA